MKSIMETLADRWKFDKLELNWYHESSNESIRGKLTG
jgi:hypothetical protein